MRLLYKEMSRVVSCYWCEIKSAGEMRLSSICLLRYLVSQLLAQRFSTFAQMTAQAEDERCLHVSVSNAKLINCYLY